MNKARIALIAVAVLAITCGVLAFNRSNFTQANVYCPIENSPAFYRCALQSNLTTTFAGEAPAFLSYNCPGSFSFFGFYTATTVTIVGTDIYITCTNASTGDVYYTVDEP